LIQQYGVEQPEGEQPTGRNDIPMAEAEETADEVATTSSPEEWSPQLVDRVNQRIEQIYQNEYAGRISREEFDEKINQLTKGFTDKNSLGVLLYDSPEEMYAYQQRLATAERLGGIDLGLATRKSSGIGSLLDLFSDEDEQSKAQRDQLSELMLQIKTGGDITKQTASDRKDIAVDIEAMRDNPDLMPVIMAKYGLDFSDLQELGVV
jgi:septum formation inhibitor MinC